MTVEEVPFLPELVNIEVIKCTSQKGFDKFDLIVEDTIQATYKVDALDGAHVLNNMDQFGLKNT